MDPLACLKRALDAAEDRDTEGWDYACTDLVYWVERGGLPLNPIDIKDALRSHGWAMATRIHPTSDTTTAAWVLWSPLHPECPRWDLVRYTLAGKEVDRVSISEATARG